MSCRTNIQDLKLNSGVKFKDATPDQIVAEMGEWWKIESFRTGRNASAEGRIESLFGLLL
jgi:hypothetical protein